MKRQRAQPFCHPTSTNSERQSTTQSQRFRMFHHPWNCFSFHTDVCTGLAKDKRWPLPEHTSCRGGGPTKCVLVLVAWKQPHELRFHVTWSWSSQLTSSTHLACCDRPALFAGVMRHFSGEACRIIQICFLAPCANSVV